MKPAVACGRWNLNNGIQSLLRKLKRADSESGQEGCRPHYLWHLSCSDLPQNTLPSPSYFPPSQGSCMQAALTSKVSRPRPNGRVFMCTDNNGGKTNQQLPSHSLPIAWLMHQTTEYRQDLCWKNIPRFYWVTLKIFKQTAFCALISIPRAFQDTFIF